jgi:hypothetical protein
MMNAEREGNRSKSIELAKEMKELMDVHIDCLKALEEAGVPYTKIEYTGEKLKGTDLKIFTIKNETT